MACRPTRFIIREERFQYCNLILTWLRQILFKAAPWYDINFCFYFRTEVVYPTDQNFHIFINIFNQHFYETRSNPNKLFVYLKDD